MMLQCLATNVNQYFSDYNSFSFVIIGIKLFPAKKCVFVWGWSIASQYISDERQVSIFYEIQTIELLKQSEIMPKLKLDCDLKDFFEVKEEETRSCRQMQVCGNSSTQ